TPYVGAQQKWPTSSGSFVRTLNSYDWPEGCETAVARGPGHPHLATGPGGWTPRRRKGAPLPLSNRGNLGARNRRNGTGSRVAALFPSFQFCLTRAVDIMLTLSVFEMVFCVRECSRSIEAMIYARE